MQSIYDFLIEKGKLWGIADFFKDLGPFGTFFLMLVGGLLIILLSLLILRGILAIENKAVRTILFIIAIAIIGFGAFITVNLCIQTITSLGGLL